VILLYGVLTVPLRYMEEFASPMHDADGLIHRKLIGVGSFSLPCFFSDVDFSCSTVL
jgi:hypothetical protein